MYVVSSHQVWSNLYAAVDKHTSILYPVYMLKHICPIYGYLCRGFIYLPECNAHFCVPLEQLGGCPTHTKLTVYDYSAGTSGIYGNTN